MEFILECFEFFSPNSVTVAFTQTVHFTVPALFNPPGGGISLIVSRKPGSQRLYRNACKLQPPFFLPSREIYIPLFGARKSMGFLKAGQVTGVALRRGLAMNARKFANAYRWVPA